MINMEQGNIKRTEHTPAKNPTRTSAIPYDYIMNGYTLSPNYIQNIVSRQKVGAIGARGYGAYRFQENNDILTFRQQGPHRHANVEYFIFYATDPEHLDSIQGTTEFWVGEGKDAEPHLITKPTVVCIPANMMHLPEIYRGFNGINAQTVIYESSLWSIIDNFSVDDVLHPNLKITPITQPSDPEAFGHKYDDMFIEQDLSNAATYPSHAGKASVILNCDLRNNKYATKCIEATLVYGSEIGWGCGDIMYYQEYQARSQPHIHDSLETYVFIPVNPDHPEELGGTVEFWIGEGDDAKKIIINKPTVLLVPPNTVHLPMYIQEQHDPFIILSVLDTPQWNVFYTSTFPADFEHEVKPDYSAVPQFFLEYDASKCIKCGLCGEQCQVEGINVFAYPSVIGNPCIRCGQCALLCPTDAITVKLK